MRLDLLVKLKYESSTIILIASIRYSMRDLLSDLNNYAWLTNWRYASDTVNDVKHDFIRYVDFTHITASKTAHDDVTN